ncbi:MAG: Holliday junction branch migration protein RuvA [Nitrospinota bacterium]|nr:Holliday junction branch migration protein RuvA [Nitrospinota bacterium]
MIAHLNGTLMEKAPASVVVDVNGVGYQVFITLPTFYKLPDPGGQISLRIHTHVREDEFKLFGFATAKEQTVFEKLISISKVGPKLAISILSSMPAEDFVTAIMNKDIMRLNGIPGVGGKTAERLALEMKDKLKDLTLETLASSQSPAAPATEENGIRSDALSALINLGYKKPQAEKALAAAVKNNNEDMGLELLIKKCLKTL